MLRRRGVLRHADRLLLHSGQEAVLVVDKLHVRRVHGFRRRVHFSAGVRAQLDRSARLHRWLVWFEKMMVNVFLFSY